MLDGYTATRGEWKRRTGTGKGTYDLLLGHAGEATGVRCLTALAGDLLDLLLGTVGEVAWVGVVCHDG